MGFRAIGSTTLNKLTAYVCSNLRPDFALGRAESRSENTHLSSIVVTLDNPHQ